MQKVFILILASALAFSCATKKKKDTKMDVNETIKQKAEEFAPFKLTTDLSVLFRKGKTNASAFIRSSQINGRNLLGGSFWPDKEELLSKDWDEYTRKFIQINYGPWERLNNNEPFLPGYGAKPEGANYYPEDMTKEEFEAWNEPSKTSQYTLVRRGEDGSLQSIPYHIAFKEQIEKAADLLLQAAELAEGEGLKNYLEKRAQALLTDEYYESDVAWMEMKDNTIEFIVGPIENYEDQLFGYKASHESFILIKDKDWSDKLVKYAALLPGLQKALPCEQKYKDETPGVDSDMNVYDAIYYAGDCNAGSKTIAINLPNDEKVRETKGSRKLQLKNSMQAKFDKILVPIADLLIAEDQREHVKFDAFFENTMFS